MSIDFGIAIWGAILSTILAVIRIFEFKNDRRRIKIKVKGGFRIIPPIPPYGDNPQIVITAANLGKRPVTIVGAALLLPRKKGAERGYLVCGENIKSVEIREGQSRDFLMPEDELNQEYGLHQDKYVAYVWDAAGRVYWSHNILIRLIKLGKIK
jgi:hypothetical protein